MNNFPSISWRELVVFDEMTMMSTLYYTHRLSLIFVVLAEWNNSGEVEMSSYSDILSCTEPINLWSYSLILCAYIAVKRHILYQFYSLWVWHDQRSNPRSTTLGRAHNHYTTEAGFFLIKFVHSGTILGKLLQVRLASLAINLSGIYPYFWQRKFNFSYKEFENKIY